MIGEERNVVAAIGQRRNPDFDDVEPVEQILPKAPAGDCGGQIDVGRCDQPDIH